MRIFAEILKRDDDKRLVFGYASTEALDSQGERVSKGAIEKALPDYMRFANVREMHQASAVGVTKSAEIDDKGLLIQVKVVDDAAWEKVKEGVYKGFSIGGKSITKTDDTITELKLTEISLVDRPANPEAVYDCWKAEGIEPDEKAAVAEIAKLVDGGKVKPSEIVEMLKRQFSDKEREAAADSGQAMSDGSFPIKTKSDLANAIKAFGRAKDKKAAKAHIVARAKALGATDALPASWQKLDKAEGTDDLKDIRKGMYTVSWLANLIDTIACLQCSSAWEEEAEGDGSAVPEQLKDWLGHGAEILCNMCDEEASELMGTARVPAAAAVVAQAEPAGDLAKIGTRIDGATGAPHVEPAEQVAAEVASLQAELAVERSATAEAVQKFEALQKEISPMRDELKNVMQRLKTIEALPAAPKGPTRAVGKTEDGDIDPAPAIQPVLNEDGTVNKTATEVKSIHALGARAPSVYFRPRS